MKRGRGRPRSRELENRILKATLELLAKHGFSGLTVDEICAVAGVHKTSFYRRWTNAMDAAVDALRTNYRDVALQDTGDLAADLMTFLRAQIALLSDPVAGACQRLLVAEASVQPELASMLTEVVLARRSRELERLRHALRRQNLEGNLDVEVILLAVTGVAYNLTAIGWTIADAQLEALIAALLRAPPKA